MNNQNNKSYLLYKNSFCERKEMNPKCFSRINGVNTEEMIESSKPQNTTVTENLTSVGCNLRLQECFESSIPTTNIDSSEAFNKNNEPSNINNKKSSFNSFSIDIDQSDYKPLMNCNSINNKQHRHSENQKASLEVSSKFHSSRLRNKQLKMHSINSSKLTTTSLNTANNKALYFPNNKENKSPMKISAFESSLDSNNANSLKLFKKESFHGDYNNNNAAAEEEDFPYNKSAKLVDIISHLKKQSECLRANNNALFSKISKSNPLISNFLTLNQNTSFHQEKDIILKDMNFENKTIQKWRTYMKKKQEIINNTDSTKLSSFKDEKNETSSDDIVCVICNDGDYEENDLIVYCSVSIIIYILNVYNL